MDVRSKDDKKIRDLEEIMENKIETQVKALKNQFLKDLAEFKS